MGKIRIFSTTKAIFLAIIGIFAINSVKVHADYHFLDNKGFIGMLYDENERQIFKKLYNYMNATLRLDRKEQIEALLPQEFQKMLDQKRTGSIFIISKRGFKYALGEVLSKVIPLFDFGDDDALKLAAIYLGVEVDDILESAQESGAELMGCREFGYKVEEKLNRKANGIRRFYFVYDDDSDVDCEYFDGYSI